MIKKISNVPLLRHINSWATPDLLEIPFKFIIYFLLANELSRYEFGIVNLALLVFSYHGLSQLGVLDWLLIELPKKYIKKDILSMENNISNAFLFMLINFIIGSIIFIVYLLLFTTDNLLFNACLFFLVQSLLYQYYLHNIIYLRFTYHFKFLFKVKMIFIISKFILSFIFLKVFGLYGYLLIEALSYIVPILVIIYKVDFKIKLSFFSLNYKEHIILGLPFFGVTLVTIIAGNIDRWFVVGTYGIEQFAMYSIGIYLITAILIIPNKILSIVSQYLKEFYGKYTGDILFTIYSFSLFIVLFLTFICISISLNLIVPYFIKIFLSKYIDLIDILDEILLVSILKFTIAVYSSFLYVIEEKNEVLKSQVFFIFIYIISLLFIYFYSLNIGQMLFITSVVLLIQLVYILYKLNGNIKIQKHSLVYFILLILSVYFLFYFTDKNSFIGLLFLLVYIFVFIYLNKKYYILKNIAFISKRKFD